MKKMEEMEENKLLKIMINHATKRLHNTDNYDEYWKILQHRRNCERALTENESISTRCGTP
ncbi:MAG: hypothetical protein L3V56_03645 [Candidatus Magnetoovum sp. WYHC-5]|nr:hypothetical protein [Candidatus Magnetoovum sp. WYHC-5]